MYSVITENRYKEIMQLIKDTKLQIDLETGLLTGNQGGHGYKTNKGYLVYSLYNKQKQKDRIILQHDIIACIGFGRKIIGKQVDHINGQHKTYYDNRLKNLQLLTPKQNLNKFWTVDKKQRNQTKSQTQVMYISKKLVKLYPSIVDFCKHYPISKNTLTRYEKANKYIPQIKGFVIYIKPKGKHS